MFNVDHPRVDNTPRAKGGRRDERERFTDKLGSSRLAQSMISMTFSRSTLLASKWIVLN
jgi:hypothetical protein